jgi:hypothetical protein
VDVQRRIGQSLGDGGQLLARHSSHRVDRGADHDVRVVRVTGREVVDAGCPLPGITVVEPTLNAFGPRVTGVEQTYAQADVSRGLDQRVAHHVRVVVRRAVGLMVQVVELAHRSDAGESHLGVRGPGQAAQQVGVEHGREGVHLVAPRPERVTSRASAQGPVEDVTVAVGERQHQSSRS